MSVDALRQEAESMEGKDNVMTQLGLLSPDALGQLHDVLEAHELGTTPRALMIYVRDWIQRKGLASFQDAQGDPKLLDELKIALPASNSASRAIPMGMIMKEHLEQTYAFDQEGIDPEKAVLIDLAGSRGYVSQLLLKPELLAMRFFEKFRTKVLPEQVMKVSKAIVVDRRTPSFEEATQPFTGYADKMRVFEELEAHGDYDGRLVRIVSDIRALTADQLREHMPEDAQPILMMNNVLYQVTEQIETEIREHVFALMDELNAPFLGMETWQAHYSIKPEIAVPGGTFLPAPALVTFKRTAESVQRPVAFLDGTTGKPFLMSQQDGRQVFVNQRGHVNALEQ